MDSIVTWLKGLRLLNYVSSGTPTMGYYEGKKQTSVILSYTNIMLYVLQLIVLLNLI